MVVLVWKAFLFVYSAKFSFEGVGSHRKIHDVLDENSVTLLEYISRVKIVEVLAFFGEINHERNVKPYRFKRFID